MSNLKLDFTGFEIRTNHLNKTSNFETLKKSTLPLRHNDYWIYIRFTMHFCSLLAFLIDPLRSFTNSALG